MEDRLSYRPDEQLRIDLLNLDAGRYMNHCNVGVPINHRSTIKKVLEFRLFNSNEDNGSNGKNSFKMSSIFAALKSKEEQESDAKYAEGLKWGDMLRDTCYIDYLWKAGTLLDIHMRKHGFKLVNMNPYSNGHYARINLSEEA